MLLQRHLSLGVVIERGSLLCEKGDKTAIKRRQKSNGSVVKTLYWNLETLKSEYKLSLSVALPMDLCCHDI
eukprot:2863264-Amphidinium_carterae.1